MKKYLKMIGNILLYSVIYLVLQVCTSFIIMIVDIIKYRNIKTLAQIVNMVYEKTYILLIVSIVISLFIYYLILRKKDKNLWQRCGFRKVSLKNSVLIIIMALSTTFIASSFIYNTKNIFTDYSSISENMVKGMQSIPGIISVVIIAPIFEEILFRGLIFNELRKNMNIVASIIIQALLFGLFHGNLAQGIYAAILGAIAAIIYVWTKSIVSNMTLHICFNIAGTFIVPQILDKTTSFTYVYLGAAAIILTCLLFVLYKNTHDDAQLSSNCGVGK